MYRGIKAIGCVFFLLLCLAASAQLSEADGKLLKEARAAYAAGDYQMTWNVLEGLAKIHVDSPEIAYLMGISGMKLHAHRLESYTYLERAVALGYEPAYYPYARVLLEQEELTRAREYALMAARVDTAHRLEIATLRAQIGNAGQAISRPEGVVLESLGDKVNSRFIEHTPLISYNDSTLYFTSRRPVSAQAVTDYNNEYDENIYVSKKGNDGWAMATPLEGNVNDLLNDATVGLSADGKQMIVFKTSRDTETGNLWLARRSNGTWKLDKKLKAPINSRWVESGVAVNSNGSMYIVASDRPGGYGGMDLYRVVVFGNGELSEPQNLGPVINSEFNETSPFLLPDDRTLFFSSDNPRSIGGYDIFRSTMVNDATWSVPENLGYPLNSTRDDLHLAVSWQGRRGYLTRSDPGEPGNFDIYQANLPGFDMKANVWKVHLSGIQPEEYKSVNIAWYSHTDQKLGVYVVDDEGMFLFVLLPGEAGMLKITCKGYGDIGLPFEYNEYEAVKEFKIDIELKEEVR